MFDLHKLLNKVVNWVNSIGESKVVDNTIKNESISAIKVKVKPVEEYKESPWVKNEKKEPKSHNIVTGTTQSKAHIPNPYVDMRGLSSTSMHYTTSDEYLDDILSDGYNIRPVDITPGHRNAPPPPRLNKKVNKNKKYV